jgi:type VI secretion system secreted protein Hcp
VQHKGWIEVSSFQLEQVRTAATTIGSATGGAGAGKVSVHDISITKRVDKSTPSLFKHCANGVHIPNGQISMRKAGGTQQEYLVIKLTDIFVSSYRAVGGGGGGAGATETFTLNAGNATVEYTGAPTSPGRSAQLAPGAVALAASTPTPTPKPGQNPATMKR